MIRRPPRSTLDRSSAASDVYKRQTIDYSKDASQIKDVVRNTIITEEGNINTVVSSLKEKGAKIKILDSSVDPLGSVSYTHLRAHETVLDLVCRLLLEKKKINV